MSKYKIKPLDPDKLHTYPLSSRKSKVNINDFARVYSGRSLGDFVNSLPDILVGKDFKNFISLVRRSKEKKKTLLFAMGAHVIKVGLSPVIIDLMKEGWISGLAMNGSGIIHDFEIACGGQTSEDVAAHIKDGRFGMARETGEMLNEAINKGRDKNIGLGEAVGLMMSGASLPYAGSSIVSSAYELGVPVTVHVAIGTDIIHFHPKVNGEALGSTSLRDFFLFCSLVERLEGGGVFINAGSAVILPEVFLKAVSVLRNKGKKIEDFSTAVFDFNRQYRPQRNVVQRPHGERKRGFYFIGHHEIMIPLFAAALRS